MLCAGIAAADGNRVGSAAQRVVAKIGSSKLIAGVSAVSANLPRYRGCCGGRARRAAPAPMNNARERWNFSPHMDIDIL